MWRKRRWVKFYQHVFMKSLSLKNISLNLKIWTRDTYTRKTVDLTLISKHSLRLKIRMCVYVRWTVTNNMTITKLIGSNLFIMLSSSLVFYKLYIYIYYTSRCVINIEHVRILLWYALLFQFVCSCIKMCSFIPILWVIFLFHVTVYVIKWSNKRMQLASTHRTATTAAAAYRYPCFLNYRLLLCECTRHGLLTLNLLKCRSIEFGTGFTSSRLI